MTRKITLRELRLRSGIIFKDGRRTELGYDSRTVQKADKENSGSIHIAQQKIGQQYFIEQGYRLFPHQVGVKGVKAMADFAAARYKKVVLVECLADFPPDSGYVDDLCKILLPPPSFEQLANHLMNQKVQAKRQMASKNVELWFVVESGCKKILEKMDYHSRKLPNRYTKEFRELKTTFWICRPTKNPC